MNKKIETFLGPGLYLVIPLTFNKIVNPDCKAFDGPPWDKYGDYNSPPCTCIYPTINVPFGYNYTRYNEDNDFNVEILGPAALSLNGKVFWYEK